VLKRFHFARFGAILGTKMLHMLLQRRLPLTLALLLSAYSAEAFFTSPRFATIRPTQATNRVRVFSENDITQGFAELSEEAPFSLQDRVLEVCHINILYSPLILLPLYALP
jgi:hypothetical protein